MENHKDFVRTEESCCGANPAAALFLDAGYPILGLFRQEIRKYIS